MSHASRVCAGPAVALRAKRQQVRLTVERGVSRSPRTLLFVQEGLKMKSARTMRSQRWLLVAAAFLL